jgi:hypothetical protein
MTESCKNEHPGSARDGNRAGGGGFGGGSSNNRFGAFNSDRYRPAQDSGSTTFGSMLWLLKHARHPEAHPLAFRISVASRSRVLTFCRRPRLQGTGTPLG